jgi:hypothetical protein
VETTVSIELSWPNLREKTNLTGRSSFHVPSLAVAVQPSIPVRETGKKIKVGLFSLISPLQPLDGALSPDTEWEAHASSTREEVLQVLLEPGSQANPMREACFMYGCTGDGNNVFQKMTGGVKSRKREYIVSLI